MPQATTTFGTYDLTNAIKIIQPPTQFLLDTFFKKTIMSEKCTISFDVTTDGEHIAPFVHPCVEGKIVEGEGYQTSTFDPAYIKIKRVLKPKDTFARMAGEQFGGTMSNQQRRDMMFMEELMYQKQRIMRRKEVMAAEALFDSRITVAGDGFPEAIVDFNRDPNHTQVLTGTNLWTDAASTPLQDIENLSNLILDGSGFAGDSIIISPATWNILTRHQDVIDLLDIRRGVRDVPIVSPEAAKRVQFKGYLGEFPIFVYSGQYREADGTVVKYVPDNKVLMVSSEGLYGTKYYGAIQDHRSLMAEEYFVKKWDEEDPSVEVLMTQSAPLVVPMIPNATAVLTVA